MDVSDKPESLINVDVGTLNITNIPNLDLVKDIPNDNKIEPSNDTNDKSTTTKITPHFESIKQAANKHIFAKNQ